MDSGYLKKLINFLLKEIELVINDSDIENDKDIQRMYLAIEQVFKDIAINLGDLLPVDLYEEYVSGLENANNYLTQAGLGVGSILSDTAKSMNAPMHIEAITSIVSDTMLDMSAAIRTAKMYAHKNLDESLDMVKDEITRGMLTGLTTRDISKRVAMKFGEQKMTSFVTKDGKHLPLDFYAETVVRTKKQTAHNHAHLNRYKESNVKHVTVTGNIPTCATCAKYRGIVFSTQRGDKFPYINLYTTFPLHPNCRCNFRPFVMKFKSDKEVKAALSKANEFNPDQEARSDEEKAAYDKQQKAQARARREALTYDRMKRALGSKGPQTLNEYLFVKKNDKNKYHEWVAMVKKTQTGYIKRD